MEILPSVMEAYGELLAGIVTCEVENTPCRIESVSRDTLCRTPILTPSAGVGADILEAEAQVLSPYQIDVASKPPPIPLRELDIKHSEAENVPRKIEMSAKIMPPLAAVAILLEMPFKERNREEGKRMLPPHIKVPPKKLFGYPERYKSPTDAMVSPISKGLLARNRRPARTLAPVVPPKALENTFQDVVVDAGAGKSG